MANFPTQTDSNSIDRLSNLPDVLLVTILSFLPTHISARTSLLSRRFRHLWEASPSLALISRDLSDPQHENFVAMAKRALLSRNPSHPLLSLRLEVSRCDKNVSLLSSMLAKARSLDLRHLTIDGFWYLDLLLILPDIFTINSLRYLSIYRICAWKDLRKFNFPSGITSTCLRSLSLGLYRANLADLNPFLSQLCSLEDLHLNVSNMLGLSISSQTIRKLKLISRLCYEKLDNVVLSLPLLESLHLETHHSLQSLSHNNMVLFLPSLRKAVINLVDLDETDVSAVARLLNCISHVEELNLHAEESKYVEYPIPILLESGKDVPHFSNLKHLDVTLCFHERNLEAVAMMLHNCPILESLKLFHEFPCSARGRKRKDWGSKLPCNADGNYRDVYFRNLHLKENRKEVIKLLSKKCSSKRQG